MERDPALLIETKSKVSWDFTFLPPLDLITREPLAKPEDVILLSLSIFDDNIPLKEASKSTSPNNKAPDIKPTYRMRSNRFTMLIHLN